MQSKTPLYVVFNVAVLEGSTASTKVTANMTWSSYTSMDRCPQLAYFSVS